MDKILSVPGAAWVALLVLLTGWLQNFFPNEAWLAAVLGGIALIIKAIETFWPTPPPSVNERMMATQPDTVGRKVLRVFLG